MVGKAIYLFPCLIACAIAASTTKPVAIESLFFPDTEIIFSFNVKGNSFFNNSASRSLKKEYGSNLFTSSTKFGLTLPSLK